MGRGNKSLYKWVQSVIQDSYQEKILFKQNSHAAVPLKEVIS